LAGILVDNWLRSQVIDIQRYINGKCFDIIIHHTDILIFNTLLNVQYKAAEAYWPELANNQ